MRIGIDGGCLSNRRGFGRFARQPPGAAPGAESAHEFVVFVDGPSSTRRSLPDVRDRDRGRGEAPSRAASAQAGGVRDMLAMGRAAREVPARPDVLPRDLQLLPGLERSQAGRDDARHARRWHTRSWFSPAARGGSPGRSRSTPPSAADRIVTVSRDLAARPVAWFGLADDRIRVVTEGPDPIFRPRPTGPVRRRPGAIRHPDPGRLPALRRRLEPAQEPAPAGRGVRPVGAAGRRDARARRRHRRRLPHPRPGNPRRAIAASAWKTRVILTGFVPDDGSRRICTAEPTRWCSRRCWRGSGCRRSRRWPAGRPCSPAGAGRCPRSSATPGRSSTRRRRRDGRGDTRLLGRPARRDGLAAGALARGVAVHLVGRGLGLLGMLRLARPGRRPGRAA